MNSFISSLSATALFLYFVLCTLKANAQPLETVTRVDLERYTGRWYEIASYPQRFQHGCNCTTAEYTWHPKGYLIVENRCNRDSVQGKQSYIRGKAFVEPETGNAKLKVQFFWPFKGRYWIIYLSEDYSYAVVGHPNREYLWILSRTPKLEPVTYNGILARIREKGYDPTRLQITRHL